MLHDSVIGGLLHRRFVIGAVHCKWARGAKRDSPHQRFIIGAVQLFCLLMALCWLLIIVLLLLSTRHQAGKGRRYS